VRRQKPFRIERRGDVVVHLLRGDEIAKPRFKGREVSVIAVAVHIAPDLMFADGAGLPNNSDLIQTWPLAGR
jgi:hypothetical protein